jgi:hypothetical protein
LSHLRVGAELLLLLPKRLLKPRLLHLLWLLHRLLLPNRSIIRRNSLKTGWRLYARHLSIGSRRWGTLHPTKLPHLLHWLLLLLGLLLELWSKLLTQPAYTTTMSETLNHI